MAALPKFRQGRILWARLRTRGGSKETHPCVIITANQDIIQPEQFDPRKSLEAVNAVAVVGISTKFKKYPPSVALPYSNNPKGHPTTNLTQECGVCIGWYDWVVLEDDVEACGGDVPDTEFNQIATAIVRDLAAKLAAKAERLSNELLDTNELLAMLVGEA